MSDQGVLIRQLQGAVFGAPLTALPQTPSDGQLIAFLADAANGVVWWLKYRAGSASAYKWEFVGGSELYAVGSADDATLTATTWTLTNNGPQITIPLAGDYRVEFGGRTDGTEGQQSQMAMAQATPTYASGDVHTVNVRDIQDWNEGTRATRLTGLTAGTALKTYHQSTSVANYRWFARWCEVRPVRVG